MVGAGKTVGLILMIGSRRSFCAFGAWATTALLSSEMTSGGGVLGLLLALLVMAPIFGVGAYVFRKGGQEQKEFAQVQKEKQILNAVLTRGQVTINELVAELQLPPEEIKAWSRIWSASSCSAAPSTGTRAFSTASRARN